MFTLILLVSVSKIQPVVCFQIFEMCESGLQTRVTCLFGLTPGSEHLRGAGVRTGR